MPPFRSTILVGLTLAACAAPAPPPEPSRAPLHVLGDDSTTSYLDTEDGQLLAVERMGPDPVRFVLLHGWGGERGVWRRQAPALAGRGGVLALDLVGHGESGRGRARPGVGALARDVAGVLERLEVRDAVLVGHSLGGLVALDAAALAPGRVRAVVGVECWLDVLSRPSRAEWDAMRVSALADFPAFCAALLDGLAGEGLEPDLERWLLASMVSLRREEALELLEDQLFHDEEGTLGRARVPVRSINGDRRPTDAAVNADLAGDYAHRTVAGTGHHPMLERPAAFNAVLVEVLDGL